MKINGNGKKVEILPNRKNLKDWEMDKGVIIRNRKYNQDELTEKQYKNLIKTKNIKVKTEKGLQYLEEEVK